MRESSRPQRLDLGRIEGEASPLEAECLFSKAPNQRLRLRKWDIALEGVFSRDGLGWSVRNDWVVIDAAGKFVEAGAVAAKLRAKDRQLRCPEITDR